MNFIAISFSLLTLTYIIFGSLINVFEKSIPPLFIKCFTYGKFAYKGEVAILSYAYVFYLVTCTYIYKYEVPDWFLNFMDVICGENRKSYTSATKTYIAVALMTLQVFRRFYDTHFISVFGKNSRINLCGYLIGIYYYPACALAILCGAPKFASESTTTLRTFDISSISNVDMFAILLFAWSWWHQHTTSRILGDLRRNKKGVVVTDEHKLPHGDWFDYVSCPHQTAEILMYTAITILLWQNSTWLIVYAWVLSNQVETILLSHWWYQENFDKFPKNRWALIPFVY